MKAGSCAAQSIIIPQKSEMPSVERREARLNIERVTKRSKTKEEVHAVDEREIRVTYTRTKRARQEHVAALKGSLVAFLMGRTRGRL